MTVKETATDEKTPMDDFDIPFVEGWDLESTLQDAFKTDWLLKLAYSKQMAGKPLTDKETGDLNVFVLELMQSALGDDGMTKLYEHFDGDDGKVTEWFMGKANRLVKSKSKE